MSNGAPIVVRAAVKPVATLRRPLDAVDLVTGEVRRAHIERSDVAILPRAAVVGEAMVALVLADALLATWVATPSATCGRPCGDGAPARRARAAAHRGARRAPSLPDTAAESATPVGGQDA